MLGRMATEKRYSDLGGTTLVASTTELYDGAGNVTSIASYDGSSNLIDKFLYSYDAANNLASETDTQSGTPTTTSYSYDADNDLTAAQQQVLQNIVSYGAQRGVTVNVIVIP